MVLLAHPVLLVTAIVPVYTHGLFFAMGALAAALFLASQRHFLDEGAAWLVEKVLLIFVISLFVARVGFFITYPSTLENLGQIFAIWQGGLVSYWGLLSGVLLGLYIGRKMTSPDRWYAATALAALLGWGIGRIGNYFAGDSVGVMSAHWAFFYGRVPIQFFESILCFALFFFLLPKLKEQTHRIPWLVGFGYFAGRFIIDTWRDEDVFFGLHASQWLSLIVLCILALIWKRTWKRA